jgi:AraC family transcriptional regulator of arabinose operon
MIKVNGISYECYHPNGLEIYRPKGSGDYLLLFLRTNVELMLQDKYEILEPNTFFLFPKGAPQYYRKLNSPFNNDWIHFDVDSENEFLGSLNLPFLTPIHMNDNASINKLMFDLRNEFFLSGAQHNKIMDAKMHALFYKLSDIYHEDHTEPNLMNQHYKKLLLLRYQIQSYEYLHSDIAQIASKLNISSSYLAHLYKHFFRHPIGHDLIESRIDYAKTLLTNPKLTINEVSVNCGYDNIEHFSRQFKQLTGYSPNKFRKSGKDAFSL